MSAMALIPVAVDITTSMVAVVTVLAAIVFSLATLARPSRATVTWGAAFGLGVLGAYLWLAGHQTGEPAFRGAASGLLLSFEPLVWIGLRMHRGRRTPWWPVAVFTVVPPTLLVLTAGSPWYLLSFHTVFLASGVFAALVAFELWRGRPVARDIVMPLALASCGLFLVALSSAVAAMLTDPADTETQLSALRGMNAVGTLVVSTCAAFTLVLMVRAEGIAPVDSEAAILSIRRRLEKAHAQNEQSWSILDVRLDDPAELRDASTGSAFALIVNRFHDDIQEALPAAADAVRIDDDRAIVLIRGSEEAVQSHIREILTRVAIIHRDESVNGIGASASIGWAMAAVLGFEYDALIAAAGLAAERARAGGGDRWNRATTLDVPVTELRAASSGPPARRTTLER